MRTAYGSFGSKRSQVEAAKASRAAGRLLSNWVEMPAFQRDRLTPSTRALQSVTPRTLSPSIRRPELNKAFAQQSLSSLLGPVEDDLAALAAVDDCKRFLELVGG